MDKMDKVQALESALKQIERDFGKGSIMKLGDVSANMNIEVIHTGCFIIVKVVDIQTETVIVIILFP